VRYLLAALVAFWIGVIVTTAADNYSDNALVILWLAVIATMVTWLYLMGIGMWWVFRCV